MGKEIERKFLVNKDLWRPKSKGQLYRQGYLSEVKERVVRVRVAGDKGFLTVKGLTEGFSRLEFEYEIPVKDAHHVLVRRGQLSANRFYAALIEQCQITDTKHP